MLLKEVVMRPVHARRTHARAGRTIGDDAGHVGSLIGILLFGQWPGWRTAPWWPTNTICAPKACGRKAAALERIKLAELARLQKRPRLPGGAFAFVRNRF